MLSSIDLFVVIIIGLSAFWGMSRGVAREILSLVAWVAAIVASIKSAPWVASWLELKIEASTALNITTIVISFVFFLLVFSTLAYRFSLALRGVFLGGIDRFLGGIFGALRGYVILLVIYMGALYVFGDTKTQSILANSQVASYADPGLDFLKQIMSHFSHLDVATPSQPNLDADF